MPISITIADDTPVPSAPPPSFFSNRTTTPTRDSENSNPTPNLLQTLSLKLTKTTTFDRLILLAILVNTYEMSRYDPLRDDDDQEHEIVHENVFVATFTVEMVLKMLASSIEGELSYFSDGWNWLDFTVVLSALIPLIYTLIFAGSIASSGLIVVRVVRVLRPLKSASKLPKLKTMIQTLIKSLAPMSKAMLLVLSFSYIMAVFGNNMFQGAFDFWEVNVDSGLHGYVGFNNIGESMLTVFSIITQEGWAENVLYPLKEQGYQAVVVYFAIVIIVGGFWLLNLAITVLTSEYEKARISTREELRNDNERKEKERESSSLAGVNGAEEADEEGDASHVKAKSSLLYSVSDPSIIAPKNSHDRSKPKAAASQSYVDRSGPRPAVTFGEDTKIETPTQLLEVPVPVPVPPPRQFISTASIRKITNDVTTYAYATRTKNFVNPHYDSINSLPLLQAWYTFRKNSLQPLLSHPVFDYTVFLFILINTLVLAIETPYDSNEKSDILNTMNAIFTILFTLECASKLTGYGPLEYFGQPWNAFDFLIVALSLLEFLPISALGLGSDASALRSLRLFRVLRVTKAIKHLSSIRNIIIVFEKTAEEYIMFIILLALMIFIFVITGMQVLGGTTTDECEGSELQGNYDTFFNSFVQIFRILALDDWHLIAMSGVKCSGGNWLSFVFCVFWLIVGNFMMLNLFLAILIRSFERVSEDRFAEMKMKRKISETERLTATAPAESPDTVIEAKPSNSGNDTPTDTSLNRQLSVRNTIISNTVQGLRSGIFKGSKEYETQDLESATVEERYKAAKLRYMVDCTIDTVELIIKAPLYLAHVLTRRTNSKSFRNLKTIWSQQQDANNEKKSLVLNDVELKKLQRSIENVATIENEQTMTRRMELSGKLDAERNNYENFIPLSGVSLFCLTTNNYVRIASHRLVQHNNFNAMLIIVIVLSSLSLAFESAEASPELLSFLSRLDRIFTYLFTAEMILKIIAFGFVRARYAYLRDSWNRLDFIIVASSLADLGSGLLGLSLNISYIRIIRLLRVLRPLRTIKRNKRMAQAVGAILGSFMSVVNVVVLLGLIFGVFAILGTGLFGGGFWRCNDGTVTMKNECVGQYMDSNSNSIEQREWTNAFYNFDSFGNSFETLFVVCSLEGWYEIAKNAMQITGDFNTAMAMPMPINASAVISTGFASYSNPNAVFFFVVFICLANFLGLGLFVGVLCDHFAESNFTNGKSALITEEQSKWIKTQQQVMFIHAAPKEKVPTNKVRRALHYLIRMDAFGVFIIVCIIASTVLTSLTYYNEPQSHIDNVNLANQVLTSCFIFEAIVKITADGFKVYFTRMSCIFDFFLVVFSLTDFFVNDIDFGSNSGMIFVLRIFRLFRVSRLLRLLGPNSKFRMLLRVMLYSVPTLWNVSSLLLMIYFTYGVLGMGLFSSTNFDTETNSFGETETNGINEFANFRTFPAAFETLFRVSTGENWQNIMSDCADENNYDSPIAASLFFFSFVICCQYVTLNLFVAVLLQNFNIIKRENNDAEDLKDQLAKFATIYTSFDPKATQFIDIKQLPYILLKLNEPLGLGVNGTNKDVKAFMWDAEIPIYKFTPRGRCNVYFNDILYHIARRAFGSERARVVESGFVNLSNANNKDNDKEKGKDVDGKGKATVADKERDDVFNSLKVKGMVFSSREYIAVRRVIKCLRKGLGYQRESFNLANIVIMAQMQKRENEKQQNDDNHHEIPTQLSNVKGMKSMRELYGGKGVRAEGGGKASKNSTLKKLASYAHHLASDYVSEGELVENRGEGNL